MKAVVQRVFNADVVCEGKTAGRTSQGLLILLGVYKGDTEKEADVMAMKVANLRIFRDENDKMNLSLLDIKGQALAVSNFTLCADTSHGRRPSFIEAEDPEKANALYERFCDKLSENGVSKVEKGVFGGDMQVSLTNQGPVTIILDTENWK